MKNEQNNLTVDEFEIYKKDLRENNRLAVDMGNAFINTSVGVMLEATYSNANEHMAAGSHTQRVRYNGKEGFIGVPYVKDEESITRISGIDKYEKDEYTIGLLTAIARSLFTCGKDEAGSYKIKLGLGVPVGSYTKYYEKYAKQATEIKDETIELFIGQQTISYTITIESVSVNWQSCIVGQIGGFNYPALVIDAGGGTLDVSKWQYDDVSNSINLLTYFSIDKAFNKILDDVNKEHTNITTGDILYLLKEKSDIEEDKKIIESVEEKVTALLSEVRNNPKAGIVKSLVFCGGPAQIFSSLASNVFTRKEAVVIAPNPQFANAIAFHNELLDN